MSPTTAPRRRATIDLDTGAVVGFSAELVSVKRVPAGHDVSYGGEYRTDCETVLGLVGAGYAEGIPRTAMGASVTVGGRRHAIAGRVAMDQFVVDLGPESADEPGADVILFGPGGASAAEWAAEAGIPLAAVTGYLGCRTEVELTAHIPTAAAMEQLGARLAGGLHAGDAVILTGELGAGKTTFTRGLGAALNAVGTIQSPTFVIARTHETPGVPLLHIDAYRLGDEAQLDDLDLDLEGSITVAEWGAPLTQSLDSWFDVSIERASGADADPLDPDADDPRVVVIRAGGALARARLLALVDAAGVGSEPS